MEQNFLIGQSGCNFHLTGLDTRRRGIAEWGTWEGVLRPSALAREYRIRITYSYMDRPAVHLLNVNFSDKRPPHIFKTKGDALCLYHREGLGAWKYHESLVTLLPMISHWLWCYEVWLSTGKWIGDEYPHDPKEEKVS